MSIRLLIHSYLIFIMLKYAIAHLQHVNIHRLATSLGWAKHSTRPDSVRLEAWLNSRTGLVWLGSARHGVIRGLARLILTRFGAWL